MFLSLLMLLHPRPKRKFVGRTPAAREQTDPTMHGRKRRTIPPTAEEVALTASKAAKYSKLMRYVLNARKKGDMSLLTEVGKLLVMNSDVYSLWNYRREMLVGDWDPAVEMSLTAQCLEKNPKSYPAWYHRKWVLERHPELAKRELQLCGEFLDADERNFHCWNHRRFAASLTESESMDFARSKLDQNFSNYSAFHELAAHLPSTLDDSDAKDHLDLVAQAVFTEPDDQSAWWYQETLATRVNPTTLVSHVDALKQLRDLEPDSKWPVLALFRLQKHLGGRGDDLRDLKDDLLRLDPPHTFLYKSSEETS